MNIKKIIEEEVNSFGWADDIQPSIDVKNLKFDGYHYVFYFYPYITHDEYIKYVKPILISSFNVGIMDKVSGTGIIDHIELHNNPRWSILGGDLEYFGCDTEECFIHELMDEDSDEGLPNNGRVIFEIPS